MQRIILIVTFLFVVELVKAQGWSCDSIDDSIKIFNSFSKSGNNKRAQSIMPYFPLNDDYELELNYIILCTDTLPRMEIVALTEGWLGTVFTNANSQIKVSNENQIVCIGDLGQVAFDQKFIGATRVLAPIEIRVLYKDNRVRLTLLTRNYRMAYANIGQLESGTINISGTYPFNSESKHKGAYAMAYINTISKLLNLAYGYRDYLNKHTKDMQKDIPEW